MHSDVAVSALAVHWGDHHELIEQVLGSAGSVPDIRYFCDNCCHICYILVAFESSRSGPGQGALRTGCWSLVAALWFVDNKWALHGDAAVLCEWSGRFMHRRVFGPMRLPRMRSSYYCNGCSQVSSAVISTFCCWSCTVIPVELGSLGNHRTSCILRSKACCPQEAA
jgi:hypothetical protein